MTTAVRNVEEQTRRAWAVYADRVRDLEGAEYEHAEQEAWHELQAALGSLPGGDPPPPERDVG